MFDPTNFDTICEDKVKGESWRCYYSAAIEDIRSFQNITHEEAAELLKKTIDGDLVGGRNHSYYLIEK